MRRGLGFHNRRSPGVFSPSSLFQGGIVAGAWYDPSDSTTLFTTSAGTTPCAEPGAGALVNVGLMLDKSQGLVLGSQLVAQPLDISVSPWSTLGTLSSVTSNGFTNSSGGGAGRVAGILTVGKWYVVTVSFSQTASVEVSVQLDPASASPQIFGAVTALTGTISFYACAKLNNNFYIRTANNTTITFSNISVRELPGNHAIAANDTTARPELSARVNLLTRTESLTNPVWLTTAAFTSVTGGQADPAGGTNAFQLVGANKNIYQPTATVNGVNYTFRVFVRGDSNGTATLVNANGGASTTINVTTSWQAFTLAFNAVGTNDGPGIVTSGTLSTIYVAFPDSRPTNVGALVPTYQRIADQYTYNAAGFPRYLRFDGVDDAMSTPANVNLSGTDKMLVVAGVRKLSDAATAVTTELSSSISSNNGAFCLFSPVGPSGGYTWDSKGTTEVFITVANSAPITSVISGIANIGAPVVTLRVNGVQAATSTSSQGTGNFGTYPLFIGARNKASFFLNGQLYQLIVAGQQYAAGQVTSTETFVGNKTGIPVP